MFLQLVAQRLKVKNMVSRIEIDEQYNDDMRDTRTLRQKVQPGLTSTKMSAVALLCASCMDWETLA